jgi:hypothetical protein
MCNYDDAVAQGRPVRTIALRMVSSLRIQATRATRLTFPFSRSRFQITCGRLDASPQARLRHRNHDYRDLESLKYVIRYQIVTKSSSASRLSPASHH